MISPIFPQAVYFVVGKENKQNYILREGNRVLCFTDMNVANQYILDNGFEHPHMELKVIGHSLNHPFNVWGFK